MKRRHIALATSLLAGLLPQAAQACGDGAYIGQVCFMATPFCPHGTLEANGSAVNISQYQALYSLLYTTYGGDGKTTFNLPDLRGRSPRGVGLPPKSTDKNEKRIVSEVTLGQQAGFSTAVISDLDSLPPHKVIASVPVSGATGELSALSSGTGYLAGLGVKGGTLPATATAYTTTAPAKGSPSLLVTTQVTKPDQGSAVKVDNTGKQATTPDQGATVTGKSEPYYSDSPHLGLMACIVVDGMYPQKPY